MIATMHRSVVKDWGRCSYTNMKSCNCEVVSMPPHGYVDTSALTTKLSMCWWNGSSPGDGPVVPPAAAPCGCEQRPCKATRLEM